MTKKSWIILGSTLGGVAVSASVLAPVLLVPRIYKTDIKTFVQKYTLIRKGENYESLVGHHPSAKLLFYSFLYTLWKEIINYSGNNFKVNGLHNSILATSRSLDGSNVSFECSYSKDIVEIIWDSNIKLNRNDYFVSKYFDSELGQDIYFLLDSSGSYYLTCPIWWEDDVSLIWSD